MSAYEDGVRAGRLDRLLGWQSRYAWFGVVCDRPGSYSHEYSRGYHAGWRAP